MQSYPADLAEQFRRAVEGEVRFDAYSKILYSTDASAWQIEPIGVVIPRHAEDVLAAVEVAVRNKVPLLPRGGATSLSGQTVGHAVHIDFAKYMHRILEVNTEERWVRVEPGVVQDQLNRYLRPLGFQFGPDTSSSSRATIGGMIGNNSAGSHSILWGKTIDHVQALRAVLSDGSEAVFEGVSQDRAAQLSQGGALENRLYRELLQLGVSCRQQILDRFPKLIRRVSGYNLDELVANNGHFGAGYSSQPGPLNLAKLITGSEGTLAVASEAKLRIVPLPKHKALLIANYRSLEEAAASAEEIVATHPAAAEVMDDFFLKAAFADEDFAERIRFVPREARALMVVEYYGGSESEVRSHVENLRERLTRKGMGFGHLAVTDPAEQAGVWQARKDAQGLIMGVPGDRKPVAFVEDPAVSLDQLPVFLKGFREILRRYDAEGGYYGHASVGCVHVRPMIDLKQASEVRKMQQIADDVFALVQQCGGSMSGEHGDGIARSRYNEALFGPDIYQAFKKTKALFDPENLFNPGKIVDGPDLTQNLRWGAAYQTIQIQTHLDFSKEGGFARALEQCSGIGVCRKRDVGTMCPSYHATLDEEHSTRGRANALRAAMSGLLPSEEFTSKRMYDVLDLCLECKGCKRECPSHVDLAKIKYEFLAHYHEKNGTPLRARLFGHIAKLNRWGSYAPALANATMGLGAVRWFFDRFLGIDARRDMPVFAGQTFEAWFSRRQSKSLKGRPQAVLFHDCFLNHNYPQVGRAAMELLESAGYEVLLVDKECCGRPMISKGLLQDARAVAEHNTRVLSPFAERGIPILGCEPSCLLTLREEYPELVQGAAVKTVAANAWMVDEFLVRLARAGRLPLSWKPSSRKVLFHGHCHQKALIGSGSSLEALRLVPGLEVSEVNSGCCGMAGSFGFEKEHYDLSEKIARQRLIPAVEAAGGDTEIAVTGVSCRQQIRHFAGREPRHVVEILRESIDG